MPPSIIRIFPFWRVIWSCICIRYKLESGTTLFWRLYLWSGRAGSWIGVCVHFTWPQTTILRCFVSFVSLKAASNSFSYLCTRVVRVGDLMESKHETPRHRQCQSASVRVKPHDIKWMFGQQLGQKYVGPRYINDPAEVSQRARSQKCMMSE